MSGRKKRTVTLFFLIPHSKWNATDPPPQAGVVAAGP